MPLVTKWKRILRGTNTFQIILCIILFHSLASILIIYIHLMWFFSEDEKLWKITETISVDDFVIWNRRTLLNVLSSKVISNDEISITGWWMDHARWDTDIRCYNQRLSLCSVSFSSTCKPDGIRAIYQYVTFAKDSQITGFELSLTATADQLESQTIGATFGALALVSLSDGKMEVVQIQFPSNVEPLTLQSVKFTATDKTSILSVIVMLMCYGYTGSVHFTDPKLVPHGSNIKDIHKIVQKCPDKRPNLPSNTFIRQEKLIKSNSNKSSKDLHYLVTLVTQVSMDRLSALERSLQLWNGPISLVIYIATKHSEKSENEWQRLYIQKKLKNLKLSSMSQVTLAFGNSLNGDYPINTLRNIAIRQAKTKYILLLDADFQPSPDFQQRFAASVKHFSSNKKIAFVIPAFQYMELPQKSDNAPQSKDELLQLLHREEPFILPFRVLESSESHRITDYWKWYRADKPYIVNIFSDKYEPYVTLQKTHSLSMYDERFSGYGMNKVTHINELFAANYTFVVLPDVWVIHLPHKVSTFAIEFLQNAHHRLQNRLERFEFIADIMKIYKIDSCAENQGYTNQ